LLFLVSVFLPGLFYHKSEKMKSGRLFPAQNTSIFLAAPILSIHFYAFSHGQNGANMVHCK